MKYILLFASVFLGAFKSVLTKASKKKTADLSDTLKINLITFSCALTLLFLLGAGKLNARFSVPYGLAFLYAVCTLSSQLCLLKAVSLGSVSVSSLFYSCGFIIPALWGNIYYNEGINALHFIGLFCVVVSFFLASAKSEKYTFNRKWFFAALGGTFFSGLVGVIQKLFTNNYTQYSLDYFLYASFAFILLINGSLLLFVYLNKKRVEKSKEADEVKSEETAGFHLIFTALLGCVIGLANKVNTYLSGVLPSIIAFPVINGGAILTTALLSWVIFKEKLSLKQGSGILVGLAGIALLAFGQSI